MGKSLKKPLEFFHICSAGNSLNKPPEFFHNLFIVYPQYTWATHSEFFQNLPSNLITIHSTKYSMSLLRVCWKTEPNWEFSLSKLKKTRWVCGWVHSVQFMKELLVSGSGILGGKTMNKLWKNSGGLFNELPAEQLWKNSKGFFKDLPIGYVAEFF